MYENGGTIYEDVESMRFPLEQRVIITEQEQKSFNPFVNPHIGPYVFADGILAPKPMSGPDDWEQMGDIEYRALYDTLCKFNQLNRTGVEWKVWGRGVDEIVYNYPSNAPYNFVTMFVFLDVFTKICGPTARKAKRFQDENPSGWRNLLTEMENAIGGEKGCHQTRLSVQQFMEVTKPWRRDIGIPRDIHGALADFVPGMCNIFRLRNCAIMLEYDARIAEYGGEQVGAGVPDIPGDLVPQDELLSHAIIFPGDGMHQLGMMRDVAFLPRVQSKLEVAKRMLGFDLLDLCLNGPIEKLESLEYNGVAMYMAGWAAYEKFVYEDSELAHRARAVAGIDVGEYVALSVAGVFPFEVGLELALARGRAMQELSETLTDQAVCSVAGLTEERVTQLCELALTSSGREKDFCQITTAFFDRGYVVAGTTRPVMTFRNLAEQDGALQVKILPGQTANHSPIMNAVQWSIKAKVREYHHKMRVPRCDVYFNALGDRYLFRSGESDVSDKDNRAQVSFAIGRCLSEACWKVLRWESICQAMLTHEVTHFFECGPTKQLRAIMKRISVPAFENTANYVV
mmetsp:Transcript_57945/g.127039  ORF Transcript_57945/g.127039 Transcript_57945/m.127039 type:complete len:570 (-) Transcript_57945:46-1755(-)